MLTKKEKEDLIIKLIQEGKTSKEISKIAHASFTLISSIRKRLEGDDGQPSLRIQAYKMFKKGKESLDVAITLNIDDVEATRYFNEYLRLKRESRLIKIKDEFKNDFVPIINLFKEMKKSHYTMKDIGKGLKIAQEIEAKSAYLESLTEEISGAENTNNNLSKQIKDKEDMIMGLNSQINAIGKIKNSLILQLRFAQEKMRNGFFTNNVSRELTFQLP